ncbi:MAG: hypothetical protein V1492_02070 [Candidatus Micrarchaeota archaeon]
MKAINYHDLRTENRIQLGVHKGLLFGKKLKASTEIGGVALNVYASGKFFTTYTVMVDSRGLCGKLNNIAKGKKEWAEEKTDPGSIPSPFPYTTAPTKVDMSFETAYIRGLAFRTNGKMDAVLLETREKAEKIVKELKENGEITDAVTESITRANLNNALFKLIDALQMISLGYGRDVSKDKLIAAAGLDKQLI